MKTLALDLVSVIVRPLWGMRSLRSPRKSEEGPGFIKEGSNEVFELRYLVDRRCRDQA